MFAEHNLYVLTLRKVLAKPVPSLPVRTCELRNLLSGLVRTASDTELIALAEAVTNTEDSCQTC